MRIAALILCALVGIYLLVTAGVAFTENDDVNGRIYLGVGVGAVLAMVVLALRIGANP